jgi:hypothetical protein
MPFTGQEYGGGPFKFETEGGDGLSAAARPIHRIKHDDILPIFINPTFAAAPDNADLMLPVSGKIIEIVSITCTASSSMIVRLENWDGITPVQISPNFHVTASKDYTVSGVLGAVIAKSLISQGIRIRTVSGSGDFSAWAQYRLK